MVSALEEMEAVKQTMVEINDFVRDRFDPVEENSRLLGEEVKKIKAAITEVIETQRAAKRAAVMQGGDSGSQLELPDGPYAGMTPLDLKILRGMAYSQAREAHGPAWVSQADKAYQALISLLMDDDSLVRGADSRAIKMMRDAYGVEGRSNTRQFNEAVRPMLSDYSRAAMDSTTAAAGDELVATLEARELWMDANLQTLVAPLIPTSPMPSNPFEVPTQLGDVNFYPGTENVAVSASTALATAKVTLTGYELVGQVPFSFTLEEDAVIAMLPEIRAGLVRNVAEVLDDIILNADTSTTTNINADGDTIAKSTVGKGHWLLGYDGLIHLPLVDNTGKSNNHNAAVSDDMFNEIRSKLGKYGARPSELAWITDVNTFIRAQSISNFRTMDKLGPNATILNGMLGAIEGIPVVVSEQMKLADTDGKVTGAGNGTDTGRLLIVNRTQWRQGFRRNMTIDVDRDTQKRQTVVTVSFRHALTERSGTRSSATHTALQYDITGVS